MKTRGAICYLKGHLLTPALYPCISNSHGFKCTYSHTLGIILLDFFDDISVETLGEWFIHCKITSKEANFPVKTRRSFYSYTFGISFIHFLQDFSVKTLGESFIHCKITTFMSLISQIEKNLEDRKAFFFQENTRGNLQLATLSDLFLLPLFTRASQTAMLSSVSTLTPLASPCLLYTSPSPRDMRRSRMPSSA